MILLTQVNSGWFLNLNYTGLTCSLKNTHTEISFLNVNHFNGGQIAHWKSINDRLMGGQITHWKSINDH